MPRVLRCLLFSALILAISTNAIAQEAKSKTDGPLVEALKPQPRDGKWWTTRHAQKLADLKKQDRVDLLFIGDSITHGFEGGGKEVWKKNYEPRNAFNIGYSGDRTEHVIWRLQNGEVDGISPKLAVIMIGTNNTGHRKENPDHTAAGIKKIIEELKTRLPKTKILLLAIFPRDAKPDGVYRKINDAVNERIAKFHDPDKGIHFLDISDRFLEEDGTLPKSIMPDRLHPNGKGYEIWGEAMEPSIKALMGAAS